MEAVVRGVWSNLGLDSQTHRQTCAIMCFNVYAYRLLRRWSTRLRNHRKIYPLHHTQIVDLHVLIMFVIYHSDFRRGGHTSCQRKALVETYMSRKKYLRIGASSISSAHEPRADRTSVPRPFRVSLRGSISRTCVLEEISERHLLALLFWRS